MLLLKEYGISKVLSRAKLSDFKEMKIHINDPMGISKYFSDVKLDLFWIEALSLGLVIEWFKRKVNADNTYEIGIQIDDAHKTQKELFLSDGALARYGKNKRTITPFQHVVAQNVVGSNLGKDIELETITQLKNKISRRESYHEYAGLIVSVLPRSGSIDLANVLRQCDTNSFIPTFIIVHQMDFNVADIFRIDGDNTLQRVVGDGLQVTLRQK